MKHASKGSRASYALFHDQGKGAGSLLRCAETSKCDREVEGDSNPAGKQNTGQGKQAYCWMRSRRDGQHVHMTDRKGLGQGRGPQRHTSCQRGVMDDQLPPKNLKHLEKEQMINQLQPS